jgi:phosphoglycolate phosphatase
MKKMVIFDFDGVIADSFWLAHKTAQKKFPGITNDEYRSGFEGNIVEWEKNVSRPQIDIDFDAELEKEMHLVEFFDVEEAIVELSKKYRLAIVSSGATAAIRSYLEREGMLGYFPDILGWDVHASKHIKIQSLLEKYSVLSKDSVMVTDTSGDVREAEMAGVDSIGVSWGFHEMHRLEKVKTFRVIHKPEELVPTIEEFFSR